MNKDSTLNNEYKFALGWLAFVTVTFQAYFVNPGTVLMVCSDNTRTTAGIIFAAAVARELSLRPHTDSELKAFRNSA